MSYIRYIFIAFLFLFTNKIQSQETIIKKPKTAALYSAIIPGSGQIYTKQYWKIPIIYAGLITSAYYIEENHKLYSNYKQAYLDRINGRNENQLTHYTDTDLITLKDYYKRNREVSALLFALTYILNIVDASVSAHLFNYDVSEDISLNIQPVYMSKENSVGLFLSIKL